MVDGTVQKSRACNAGVMGISYTGGCAGHSDLLHGRARPTFSPGVSQALIDRFYGLLILVSDTDRDSYCAHENPAWSEHEKSSVYEKCFYGQARRKNRTST